MFSEGDRWRSDVLSRIRVTPQTIEGEGEPQVDFEKGEQPVEKPDAKRAPKRLVLIKGDFDPALRGHGCTHSPSVRKPFQSFLADAETALHHMRLYCWLRARSIVPPILVTKVLSKYCCTSYCDHCCYYY